MTEEKVEYEKALLDFEYNEDLFGKEMTVFTGAQEVVASVEYKNHVFTLESNGERGEYWLECVMYEPDEDGDRGESGFSDPFHEIPNSKEEALEIILDWYEEELKELING